MPTRHDPFAPPPRRASAVAVAGLLAVLALTAPVAAQDGGCDPVCQGVLGADDVLVSDVVAQPPLDGVVMLPDYDLGLIVDAAGTTPSGGGLEPVADADGDGLSDGQEGQIGTDPGRTDTDGDGLADLCDSAPLDGAAGYSTCVGPPAPVGGP